MASRTAFYVIAGSHGVGKTTVLALCQCMLAERGRAVATFHHRADKAAATAHGDNAGVQSNRPGWQRRLWHGVPPPVRAIAVAVADELRYARAIRRELARAREDGAPAMVDRYVYDRLIDLRLRHRAWQQIATVRLACRLMRKPTLAFVLTDTPERVYARKAELTVAEIAVYQNELETLLRRLRVPFRRIDVDGRPAEAVAHDVVEQMLADG